MLLHKLVKSLFLPLTIGLLSATSSCVTDSLDDSGLIPDNQEQGSSKVQNYRLDFLVTMNTSGTAAASRAGNLYEADDADSAGDGDFVKGTEDEHRIGNGMVVLFKGDRFHSYSLLAFGNLSNDPIPDHNDIFEFFARAEFTADDANLPDKCLLFINASHLIEKVESFGTSTTLEEVLAMSREDSGNPYNIGFDTGSYSDYFTMTNSSYIDGGTVVNAVTILPTHIQSRDQGFDESKVIHVPVERMTAKVTFGIDVEGMTKTENGAVILPGNDGVICDHIDENGNPNNLPCEWRATVTGWAMNALERKSRYVKNITTSTPYSDWGTQWQDASNFRSYWAVDENYSTGYYPDQYRKAVDVELDSYGTQTSTLLNYSFNDLDARCNGNLDAVQYIPENTYDYSTFNKGYLENGYLDMVVGTHLIICAELSVKGENDSQWIDGSATQDFYRGEFGIIYKNWKDCFWGVVRRFNNTLNSQTKMSYMLYDWDGTETTLTTRIKHDALSTGQTGKQFQLCYNGTPITWDMVNGWDDSMKDKVFVKCTARNGDGRLMVWLEGMDIIDVSESGSREKLSIFSEIKDEIIDPEDPLYGDLYNENISRRERACTANDIKSLLYEWVGPVDHYTQGKMYYAAPVKITESARGVVRNAWYRYTLKGVKTPGVSVDELNQLIIPNDVETFDQTNLVFDIIGWHTFEFTAPLL